MMKRPKVLIVFALILLISITLAFFAGRKADVKKEALILNVSLYKDLPHYDSFEKAVEECWKKTSGDRLEFHRLGLL